MPRTHSKPVKPTDPHVLRLRVVRTERVGASIVRVTLGGDDLDLFTPMGLDQWFRLFLPRDPHTAPLLPTSAGAMWWPQLLRMPENVRPYVRNYTVAGFRGGRDGSRELDVDFVIHESADSAGDPLSYEETGGGHGVASAWATAAEPGMPVGLLDQGIGWNPPGPFDRTLIVGDETALPAVAGIARDLPAEARGTIILEVPHASDRRDLGEPEGVEVVWLPRDETDPHKRAQVGRAALEHASATELPGADIYAYVSGEQSLATGLRRALVARGVPKSHITFCGYWRMPKR